MALCRLQSTLTNFTNLQITETEAQFFKSKYQKLFETMTSYRDQEQILVKKCKSAINDALAEKIVLEKAKVEEAEELQRMRRAEEHRNTMQKELEFTEQRDTMAKFELSELCRVHEELTIASENMSKENQSIVGPVLKKLHDEVFFCFNQLTSYDCCMLNGFRFKT